MLIKHILGCNTDADCNANRITRKDEFMHCPESFDGNLYVELVAAMSILLSQRLSALENYILAEFLQAVSSQMITIAAFKEIEELKNKLQ